VCEGRGEKRSGAGIGKEEERRWKRKGKENRK
jgi:hypothetical protein